MKESFIIGIVKSASAKSGKGSKAGKPWALKPL